MIETAILSPTGLQPTPYTAESLKDALRYEPDGVYTVARTFQGHKTLLLDAHLDRLEESARLENIPSAFNRGQLRAALRELIKYSGNPDSRFRITIPRDQPNHLYLALERLNPVPDAVRENGVKVVTNHLQRQNPIAKSTAWMSQREQAFAGLSSDIYEVILVNEAGELLEGTTSNFYAVLDGQLRTANEGILNGISRKALLGIIRDLLPLNLTAVTLTDIPHLSAAFLTSSSRGVVSVVEMDGISIGGGKPESITQELAQRYDEWTEAHLEEI
jgi:branched-chain amino acid aminotransferase